MLILLRYKDISGFFTAISLYQESRYNDIISLFSELPQNKPSNQQPAGIHKCNHPRCLTCSFLQEGQTNYTFFNTNESRKISDYISCNSKNAYEPSHVTQHYSHKNRKPQKQTEHPSSYPSILHFPKSHLL